MANKQEWCYLTAMKEGLDRLTDLGDKLKEQNISVRQRPTRPNALAMIPKVILHPTGRERIIGALQHKELYVIEARGNDVKTRAQTLRNALGYNTEDLRRVHIAKTRKERSLIDRALSDTVEQLIDRIRSLTMNDLK